MRVEAAEKYQARGILKKIGTFVHQERLGLAAMALKPKSRKKKSGNQQEKGRWTSQLSLCRISQI